MVIIKPLKQKPARLTLKRLWQTQKRTSIWDCLGSPLCWPSSDLHHLSQTSKSIPAAPTETEIKTKLDWLLPLFNYHFGSISDPSCPERLSLRLRGLPVFWRALELPAGKFKVFTFQPDEMSLPLRNSERSRSLFSRLTKEVKWKVALVDKSEILDEMR